MRDKNQDAMEKWIEKEPEATIIIGDFNARTGEGGRQRKRK